MASEQERTSARRGDGDSKDNGDVAGKALIVFGASGDLFERLLVPGLGTLLSSDAAGPVLLLGTGRSESTDDEWRDKVSTALLGDEERDEHSAAIDEVISSTRYLQGDPTEVEHLRALLEAADGRTPVLYFALPPSVVDDIISALGEIDLPTDTVLAFEKPFGTDADSAAALSEKVHALVPEERVHRTDHFLTRPQVRGLLGLRFANTLLGPVWDHDHISAVEIVYDETLGLEDRAQYYDGAGALVDMIQSHLLQVLALLTLERPAKLDPTSLRDRIAEVLAATSIAGDPTTSTRRGRYVAGSVDGEKVPGYLEEDGVDPDNDTETLAQITVEVDTDRWRGLPITLRSGKAIADPRQEIRIEFRAPQETIDGLAGTDGTSVLRIPLKDGKVSIQLPITSLDDPTAAGPLTVTGTSPSGDLDPYGSVLAGVLGDDPLFSVRDDAAVRCWEIIAPVLRAWQAGDVPMDDYPAGSAGPDWS